LYDTVNRNLALQGGMPPPICFHPAYEAPLPDGHRFPMRKYGLLAEILRSRGLVPDGFVEPEPASAAMLERAHEADYVAAVLDCAVSRPIEREIGLPVTEALVRRSRASVGGTVLAARLALAGGLAGSAAGGSHHARRSQGAGFCVLNDVAVAALTLRAEGLIGRALIVDLDVHQGDGTADCLSREPDLFTLSIHCEKNYPSHKIPSDLDIGLPDGLGDGEYLAVLEARLPPLLDALRPDIVFYNAGVDPHRDDRLGRLNLSNEGLYARDRFVVRSARARGLPIVGVIGGGYSADVEALAARHALVFQALAAEAEGA